MKKRPKDPSYEWITLRETNIDYVSSVIGIPRSELEKMLEAKKKEQIYEVKLPLGVNIFTRNER